MLEAMVPSPASPARLLATIAPLADGNPFLVEELVYTLAADGAPPSLVIPHTVRDAVEQRVGRLGAEARQVLTLAAVAGRRFDFGLLLRLTGHDELNLLRNIKALVDAHLVAEQSADQFAFRHALTREAIYAGLLTRERLRLHRELGEALEQVYAHALDSHLADLAYHFFAAGVWESALAYARRASAQARATYALRPAVEQFTRAIEASRQLALPPAPDLYVGRGGCYALLGEFSLALADYEQALAAARAAGDQRALWQALTDLGLLWAGRDYEPAGAHFVEALSVAQGLGDPALQAHSLNRIGNWLVNTNHAEAAIAAHHEALAIFEAQQDAVGLAATHDLLGLAYGFHGQLAQAVEQYDASVTLLRAQDDPPRLAASLSTRALWASPSNAETTAGVGWSFEMCVRDAEEAIGLARQIGAATVEAYTELAAGKLCVAFGVFGAAHAHALRALRIAGEIEHQQWMAAAQYLLGKLSLALCSPQPAIQSLGSALDLARTLGSHWWIGNSSAYLALAWLLDGQPVQAVATLEAVFPCEQAPRNVAERRLAWAWAELALAQGEPQLALLRCDRLLTALPGGAGNSPIPALMLLRGSALVAAGRLDEAAQSLEAARLGASAQGSRPLLWRIQRELAWLHRRRGQPAACEQELAAARATVAALAASLDDASLREPFERAALASMSNEAPGRARRARPALPGGLSAREHEVAGYVARGLSNRQIAEALIVGERTVETHVSNILGKLGFNSRAQIAAWAVEQRLAAGQDDG